MSDDIPQNPLPDGDGNVAPAGGTRAVTDGANAIPTGIKDTIKAITGRDYPTDEAAIKSVKDTFAFVGGEGMKINSKVKELTTQFNTDETGLLKLMENIAANQQQPNAAAPAPSATVPQATAGGEVATLAKRVDEMSYFEAHPEHKDFRAEIVELRDATGKSIEEVVKMPTVSKLLEKAKAHDDSERSRSALHSNPALGAANDKITSAREAQSKGDHAAAQGSAVDAVLGTFTPKS